MSSGDTPYYTFQYPNPITSYNTLQIGQCEIDACGTTALKAHGDILLDGSLWSMDECAGIYFSEDISVSSTANLWSASVVNIEGSSVFSNSIYDTNITGDTINLLSNTSNVTVTGLNVTTNSNVSCNMNAYEINTNSVCCTNISGNTVNLLSNSSNINISGVHVNVSGALLFHQYNTNSIGIPYTATAPVSGTTSWYAPGRVYMTQVNATSGGSVYALAICP